MKILIELTLIFSAVYVFSFFKWCLKEDRKNIIGNISILFIGLCLIATVIYTHIN